MAEKSLITNHPINQTIRNILRLFNDKEFAQKLQNLAAEPRAIARSIELFARQTEHFLDNASDFEVSFNGLRQVQNNLQNVWTELNAFNSDGNEGHITNAGSNLDGALNAASWTFFNRPPKGSKAYGETIDSVRTAAQGAIKDVSEQAKAFQLELNTFSSRLEENASKTSQNEQKLTQISNDADAHLSEITAEFAGIKAQIEEERQQDRKKREEEFAAFSKARSSAADALIKRMEDYEAQARKILQIVGNIGITGNFQKRAVDEGKQANTWRWVTIGLFGVGVALVAVSLGFGIYQNSPIDVLLIRMAIGVAISLPAIYTARESARHRTNSDRAKQVELELASLTPFIEKLPDEDKWKVLERLTPVYFGGEKVENHEPGIAISPNKLVDVLGKLSDKIP